MKHLSFCLLAASVLALPTVQAQPPSAEVFDLPSSLQRIVEIAHTPENPYVLIEAHRGALSPDHPENSASAIEFAVDIGADWVEIDVRTTADGQLVLMHDRTLNRTTTLRGNVTSFTLDEIRASSLLFDDGRISDQHPLSLSEALDLMHGRILFRLDLKCAPDCTDQAYGLVAEKDMLDQAVYHERERFRAINAGLTDDQIIVVGAKIEEIATLSALPAYVDYIQVKDFNAEAPPLDLMAEFAPHVRMVAYPYNDRRSGGRGDERSVNDPDGGWGWLVDAGADVLLTDRPEPLIAYLESTGHR